MEEVGLVLRRRGERTVHFRVGRAEFEYTRFHGRFPGEANLRARAVTFHPHSCGDFFFFVLGGEPRCVSPTNDGGGDGRGAIISTYDGENAKRLKRSRDGMRRRSEIYNPVAREEGPSVSPAFCNTTCASMDLLMFDEQTVPIDNFDGSRRADGGGIPGGVYGRCIPGG